MSDRWSRRGLLKLGSMAVPFGTLNLGRAALGARLPSSPDSPRKPEMVADLFPTQPPELTREFVTVAHFNLQRVKELAEPRPSLARAAWDWGFGDWEDALGAASHMGNRPIAEYLIFKGARSSLFSAAMMGELEVVKAFAAAQPGVQRIRGPHSIALLAHAKVGGERARPVFDFLQSLGDAGAESAVPLSTNDIDAVRGTYVFGSATNDRIEVTIDDGQVLWTRTGMMGRPLFHIGNRVFYPWGAPEVRIRFAAETGTTVMTIDDPDVVLVASRKQPPK